MTAAGQRESLTAIVICARCQFDGRRSRSGAIPDLGVIRRREGPEVQRCAARAQRDWM